MADLASPVALAELDCSILDRLGRERQLAALKESEAAHVVDHFTNGDLTRARAPSPDTPT